METRAAPKGTARKTLFATADGHPVEAVLMLVAGRATVCVSTQVGCAVGCAFCASGRLGLRRDLTAEEIVDQVLHFARVLRDDGGRHVTNVVFMGMGEPFHTYDADAARLPAAQRPGRLRSGRAVTSPSPPSASSRASTASPPSRCSSTSP